MIPPRLLAAIAAALGFGAAVGGPFHAHAAAAPNHPRTTTPIEHLVVVMQENHTYDNYFGTYPRGDGLPRGVCMPLDPDRKGGRCVRPFHIGDNGIVPRDLDHSRSTYLGQLNGGRMDGFVRALERRNQDGRLAMAHYDGRDLPYYWNLADEYVLFDRFFSSSGAGSFLNHFYWVAGAPARSGDRISPAGVRGIPTIFDRLEEAGISWKFYVQNYEPRLTYRTVDRFPPNRASQVIWVPLLNIPRFIDDPRLNRHIVDLREYYRDAARGRLPAVAFIAPSGPSEHPPSSVVSGQAFVRTLINQLVASPHWRRSAFLLTYDDWGGWYDHVRPPRVDAHGYGFRVPALLVSPYARRGHVDSVVHDFTSILRFIEDNWRLKPLAQRDRRASSIATGLDFGQPPRPPTFTSAVRSAPAPDELRARTALVYVLYGGAILLTAGLAVWASRRGKGRGSAPLGRRT